MPAPLLVLAYELLVAIIELAATIVAADEMVSLGEEIGENISQYRRQLTEAEKLLRANMVKLEEEIIKRIDADEKALLAFTNADAGMQSETTKKGLERKGEGGTLITAAIQQNIPFRQVVSMVCAQADKIPKFQLRAKKGTKTSQETLDKLPKSKKELLFKIMEVGAEEAADIQDLDAYITVRLKQLMTNFIFELMDDMLDWKTPLKAEACFGAFPDFEDPKLAGGNKLYRAGSAVNPFYPLPYNKRGAISADLAIPDYRKQALTKSNLFAIIEIKFQNDRIKEEQFKQYDNLNKACAKVKTATVGIARTLNKKGVTKGCRVSLFRFPEDIAVQPKEHDKQHKEGDTQAKDEQQNKIKTKRKGK
jgi:hypothetical protein